jgi:hypothetical protein
MEKQWKQMGSKNSDLTPADQTQALTKSWNKQKILTGSIVVILFLLTLTLNISRAVRADYNHDEDQFISSARLLLDEHLLPYRDYPYFHTPYLIFVYALIFSVTGNYSLLAARLFSSLCATASVVLVFWMVLYFFRAHPAKYRYLVAIGILFLYLANPLFAATAGISWNHNLSVLCMLGSLCLAILAPSKKTPEIWIFTSGLFLGLAIGVRLSSLTSLPAFLLALFWWPGSFTWKRFIRLGLSFAAGLIIALLPLLWLFYSAPQQFIFGNLVYPQLNTEYRLNVPVAYEGTIPVYGTRTLADKFDFLWNNVILQPINLLLFISLVFWGWTSLAVHLGRKSDNAFRNILVFASVPLVAIGGFFPTPTWYQYFYAPLPFALLAIALGLTYLTPSKNHLGKWFIILLLQIVILSNIFALKDYRRMSFLRYIDLWKPLVIHQAGVDLRERLGVNGEVFTVAPIYPLEGGLKIYPSLSTGVFAFRTGSLLSEQQRQQQGIISSENFEAYLDKNPPNGILTGFDQVLEKPLVQYATSRGYQSYPIDKGLILWKK